MKRFRVVELTEKERFKLRVLDAYNKMEAKNVRYLCKLFGIHHSTFYRWKKNFDPYNLSSIKYKSRKTNNTRCIDWNIVVDICEWKRGKKNKKKSHYYLYQLWLKQGKVPPCCPKTIYNWWKKRGLIDVKRRRKRRSSKLFNQAKYPGELIQIDVKYLEGRCRFQYTAIDVVSKWRYLKAYKRFNQENSIDFVKRLTVKAKVKDINITRIQTDNGTEFQTDFVGYLNSVGIKHQYTWVRTPDQNGCVERSHRTDDDEFYHQEETKDMNLEQLNQALEEWTNYYNTKRLHFSLNFDTHEEYLEKHKVSHI